MNELDEREIRIRELLPLVKRIARRPQTLGARLRSGRSNRRWEPRVDPCGRFVRSFTREFAQTLRAPLDRRRDAQRHPADGSGLGARPPRRARLRKRSATRSRRNAATYRTLAEMDRRHSRYARASARGTRGSTALPRCAVTGRARVCRGIGAAIRRGRSVAFGEHARACADRGLARCRCRQQPGRRSCTISANIRCAPIGRALGHFGAARLAAASGSDGPPLPAGTTIAAVELKPTSRTDLASTVRSSHADPIVPAGSRRSSSMIPTRCRTSIPHGVGQRFARRLAAEPACTDRTVTPDRRFVFSRSGTIASAPHSSAECTCASTRAARIESTASSRRRSFTGVVLSA